MLAIYLRQLDGHWAVLSLLVVVNGRFHRLLVVVVSFHIAVWIVVSWNIHNWRTLCQFTSDLISSRLLILVYCGRPVVLHLVHLGVAPSFGSRLRNSPITISLGTIRHLLVRVHVWTTSRNIRPAILFARESFRDIPGYIYFIRYIDSERGYLHGESIDSLSIALAIYLILIMSRFGWLDIPPILLG